MNINPKLLLQIRDRIRPARFYLALVATVAACGFASSTLANPGDLYVTDLATGSIFVFTPDGTQSTFATGIDNPQGLAFDQAKNLYVATGVGRILKFDLNGNQTIFYPTPGVQPPLPFLSNPIGVALDGSDLLVAESGADQVTRLPLDGGPPHRALFTSVTDPFGVAAHAFSQSGFTRYVAHDNSLLVIPPDSDAFDIDLGVGGRVPAAITRSFPDGSTEQDVYVSTDAGTILKLVDGSTTPTTFASGLVTPTGIDFRPARFSGDTQGVGNLYVADTDAGEILEFDVNGNESTFVSGIGSPNFVAFEVSPTPSPTVLLQNISTRAQVQGGDEDVLIGGFIVTGGDPSTTKEVVVRALGPSLGSLGVTGVLGDPTLELHGTDPLGNDVIIATNNNWKTNTLADRQTIINAGLDKLGTPPNQVEISDSESVIVQNLATLDPAVANSGEYTAIVKGSNLGTGIALVEVYDLDDPTTSTSELANISTRGLVGTDQNVMIGGIIVGPTDNSGEVILRALGPSLPLADALADPTMDLKDADGNTIKSIDNWMDNDATDIDELNRTGLAPTNDSESAIVATLTAGGYTAIVSGVNDTTGVALVEAYHIIVPPPAK